MDTLDFLIHAEKERHKQALIDIEKEYLERKSQEAADSASEIFKEALTKNLKGLNKEE